MDGQRFLTGAEPAGGDQFIERPPGDQVAPRLGGGEAGGVGAQRRHVYENVNLFQCPVDPFGEDFEAALKLAKTVRTKKTSCSSFESGDTTLPASSTPTTPVKSVESKEALPTCALDLSSPPVPAKLCSRSTSRVSRISVSSSGSDRTAPANNRQYSYDEVSISSNFKKPVVHLGPPPSEKVYDVFKDISFSSPLSNADDTAPTGITQLLSASTGYTENQERMMNSLESDLSSLNLGETTTRINSANRTTASTDMMLPLDSDVDDDPYENIEELRHALNPPENTQSSILEKSPLKSPPEPPPRNPNLKLPVDGLGTMASGAAEVSVSENVYSECSNYADKPKAEEASLFDRLMNEPGERTSCTSGRGGGGGGSSGGFQSDLGAKPKSSSCVSSTKTLDIRHTVAQWYDDAAEEVERDLSLDIQQLEKQSIKPPQPSVKKSSYEHVFLATTGRMQNGEPVPRPTATLLRDFDPCFDNDTERKNEEEEEEAETSDHDFAPDNADNEVRNGSSSETDIVNGGSLNKKSDNAQSVERVGVNISDAKSNRDAVGKSPKKFSLGGASPKKINFGPPKPPRNFDYANSPKGAANKADKRLSEIAEEPKKEPLRLKSPRDLIFSGGRGRKSSSPTGAAAGKTPSPPPLGGKGKSSETKKRLDDVDNSPREENLYVTLPEAKGDAVPPPDRRSPSLMAGSPPLSSTPPPLPASLPPSATKPKQTMYENVWIENANLQSPSDSTLPPQSSPPQLPSGSPPTAVGDNLPPATPPRVPPRVDRAARKAKLMNAQSDLKGSLHSKSDSMDSGSSLSSHNSHPSLTRNLSHQSLTSLATTDSNNSKEQLEGADSPATSDQSNNERKKKLGRLASGRSFSVASIKFGKLPGIADNIKRRMSDQVKPAVSGLRMTARSGDTPDDSDEDEDLSSESIELPPATRRSSILFPDFRSSSRNHSGAIFVLSSRKKQMVCKWCVLGEGYIKWFNEETSLARPKENVMLNNIFTVTKMVEKESGPDQDELHCFSLAAISAKGKFTVFTLGCTTCYEREVWMEKIVQSLGTRLSTFSMVGVERIGWAYLKAGFAAEWSLAWLYLADRHIVYATQDSIDFEKIDLKKTKDVFVRKDSKNLSLPNGFTKHPVLVCDFNDRSLYILLGVVDEVATWRAHIEEVAFTNNNILADQQVTHENVPVIVDKCVKFVFSHGIMTEGVYRKAGANTKINKLLAEFRSNAWAVQISRENYSEHDVANVLKRFVRQLEEPLLTDYLKDSFLKTSQITDLDKRLTRYKNLLLQLPPINYATMRKLLGHLNTVSEQCNKNLMPVYNLAPLWGPNILIVDSQEKNFGETSRETEVCADLITNYPYLFDVDMEELDKEKKLLEVLEKINYPTPSSLKRSGDVRMWCYIESRSAGKCVSISLHPSLTAGEAVLLVAKEAQLQDIEDMLIHEVVLGDSLERPVHFKEKMLDLTLRWGAWEDVDRHNNYLVLKTNKLYADALPCAVPPLSIFSEIQFSDNKPKSRFSKFLFSVASASITCYKEDKNGQTSEFNAWPVEDIIWYIGSEKKRNTPHPLNLTFISKMEPVRSKDTPYFGRVLSFSSRELFTKWIAALLVAEHGTDIVQTNLVIVD